MPGTLAQDSLAPNLLAGATLNAAGTTNGTIVTLDRPGEVAFVLTFGTVSGTSPTADVTVQGSDSSTFASGVITYGQIETSGTQTGLVRQISARAYHKYVRAIVTLGGTSPVYTGSTLVPRQPHDRRTRSVTA
jgi:hypothetical protein